MKKQCFTCGKELDTVKDFWVLVALVGNRYICKSCAREIGINNFWNAVFCTNTKALKKYVTLHPEDQFRLDQQLELLKHCKEKIRDTFAAFTKTYSLMSFGRLEREIKKYIVPNPGLNLYPEEICYFSSNCCSVKFKHVVVGSTRTSVHVGGGKKGMYLGSGTSQQVNNRQIVAENYPGNLYLTNCRIVCNAVQLSFEIPLNKITTMSFYKDGLSVMAGGKTYNVTLSNVNRLKMIITLSNEYEKRKIALIENGDE